MIGMAGYPTLHAQHITLNGKIQDSTGNPLANTNILATPLEGDHETPFAITGDKGQYNLKLAKDIRYDIGITQMGFAEIHDTIALSEDTSKTYTMQENHESLEEVKVESKMAVIVKEDTITYHTDKFKTGEERKLREILEKLPGVEVDKEGNVKVNGKKVSKLMVDDKDFFGGDTQLGVNNIPADAVEDVEALDDYNEVDFMKGLSNSDKMAVNIKLKEDKKHFMFGDNEAGGGTENRYYVAPKLFYYSPQTTVNFIGSFNNTNDAPLDVKDYMRFKGGPISLEDEPVVTQDIGLGDFYNNQDIKSRKTEFAAANLSQDISPQLRLETYSLASYQKRKTETVNDISYLTGSNLEEERENNTLTKDFTSLTKAKLRYQPSNNLDAEYDAVVTAKNGHNTELLNSWVLDSLSHTQTQQDPRSIEVGQYFRINYQPEYEHTWKFNGNYIYKNEDHRTDWDFDRPRFPDKIPAQDEGEGYNFIEDYSSRTHRGKINAKHYWVLNNFNHIYPKVGLIFFDQTYNSTNFQRLQNGDKNSFREAGFDNALHFRLFDPYIGFQYKFQINDFVFRPGVVYHNFIWRSKQFGETTADEDKGVVLPEFMAKYKVNTSKEVKLDYHLRARFQDAAHYANRLRLQDFNRLYRGNSNLKDERYHDLSLTYRNFNMSNGLTLYGTFTYKRREKTIQNTTQLEGINQVNTSIYTDLPKNTYTLSGQLIKRFRNYQLSAGSNISLSDYSRIINDVTHKYHSRHYNYKVSGKTLFKDEPNFEIGFSQDFNTSKSDNFQNKFTALNPSISLDYEFWDGFIAKADYNYTLYKDKTHDQTHHFDLGNASLYYSKTNSPWGFEIRVENVFDITYKRSNKFDQFMVFDQRKFIQPRTVLFILSYKL